jgi:hypothetical protein
LFDFFSPTNLGKCFLALLFDFLKASLTLSNYLILAGKFPIAFLNRSVSLKQFLVALSD